MGDFKEQIRARQMAIALCALAVLGLIVIEAMPPYAEMLHGHTSMLSLHLLLELFAIIIAVLVVTVSWHTVDAKDARSANVLISGFLIVASCDLVHALSYSGMPPFLSESSTPRAIFFWLMGRTFEVATMWLLAVNWAPAWSRSASLLLGLAVSCTLIWFGSFNLDMFPVTFIKGQGVTPFKAFYELSLCFLYIAVAIILWRRAEPRGQSRYYLLSASCFVMGIGDVSFTAYTRPSDFQNIFGHVYKVVAYALLYRTTFIVSIRAPFDVLRQTESRLRESEARFRTVIEQSPIGMSFARDGVTVEVNAVYLQMFGCHDIAEVRGQPLSDQIAPQCRTEVEDRIRRRSQGEPAEATYETIGLRKDGSQFPLLISAKRIELSDGPLTFGFLIDITDRKRAEAEQKQLQQQLMQSQKMESIGHLAGGIAHDFNNMLNAILGYAHLLKLSSTSSGSHKDERTQNYITAILTAGNHAKELIKQMMVYSRLNREGQEAEKPVTPVSPVLKEVVSLLRSSIPSTITINLHIEDELLKVHIVPVQLHQILLNLIINARDAIDEYGQIDLRVAKYFGHGICNACNKDFSGEYVEVSVKDTGCGIPDHLLSSIFEPFFTTKAVGKGTGMGLSVVHGHVHNLGGHITVGSRVGQGTEFNILLPLANEDASRPDAILPQSDEAGSLLSSLRIMVVDDERVVSAMLHELLSFHGAQVTTFNRSEEALSAFERATQGIDMVITDETMPGLSGLDMAKAMLKRRPDLPVILCTGHSEHVNAEIARQSGIAEFIYKPVDVKKLVQRIVELCSPQSA
jgi:PAS domain S-box-containing protein